MRARTLVGAAAVSFLFLGCHSKVEWQEGIVEEELGSVTSLVESSGALLSNESMKFKDPNYLLKVRTDEGDLYTIDTVEGRCSVISVGETRWGRPFLSWETLPDKSLEGLAAGVDLGARVRFPTIYDGERMFDEDFIGLAYSSCIRVLPDPEEQPQKE